MVIDGTEKYDEIWNAVYTKLGFSPSCAYRNHSLNISLPYQINDEYSVYGINDMTDEQCDLLNNTIREIFVNITEAGQKIFALDWQHSSFLYDPRLISEQKSCRVNDIRCKNDEYTAYFHSYYPDGDYYFFIEENFKFGYLGHP